VACAFSKDDLAENLTEARPERHGIVRLLSAARLAKRSSTRLKRKIRLRGRHELISKGTLRGSHARQLVSNSIPLPVGATNVTLTGTRRYTTKRKSSHPEESRVEGGFFRALRASAQGLDGALAIPRKPTAASRFRRRGSNSAGKTRYGIRW